MKRLMTIAAVGFLALPLPAAEVKPKNPSDAAVNPLVAAARRTNRKASKTPVITDASVRNATGGHVTSTNNVTPPQVAVPRPGPDVLHNEQRASEKAAAATKAADDQKKAASTKVAVQKLGAAAEEYEGGYDDGDPSRVEHDLSAGTATAAPATKKP